MTLAETLPRFTRMSPTTLSVSVFNLPFPKLERRERVMIKRRKRNELNQAVPVPATMAIVATTTITTTTITTTSVRGLLTLILVHIRLLLLIVVLNRSRCFINPHINSLTKTGSSVRDKTFLVFVVVIPLIIGVSAPNLQLSKEILYL